MNEFSQNSDSSKFTLLLTERKHFDKGCVLRSIGHTEVHTPSNDYISELKSNV